ncbi:methionine ABC transporter permease [Haloglycomyces albus]|uniref:methionine ABC transporter permease n=1 Tax=Haloglycomyces albus TaxID=526067 RepID=UPI00046D1CA1|nr:methionine ABC transporter permease [Haloglycomyces albus]
METLRHWWTLTVDAWPDLQESGIETIQMTLWSGLWTLLGGLLLGVLLYLTSTSGPRPSRIVNFPLGTIVNIGRSAPFVILMVAIVPFTKLVAGTTLGTTAAIVPLSVAAIPFFARIVENALLEVPPGLTEAARSMGATTVGLIGRVILPEATPGLIRGFTVTVVTIVAYSAMAGTIGGGGLGDLAFRDGYQRFQTEYMILPLVLLVIGVQIIQFIGDRSAKILDRR